MSTETDIDGTGDDWLERALRHRAPEETAYIDDDGFVARVMQRLPAPVVLPAWRKPAIAILWTLAAAAGALALPGALDEVLRGAMQFAAQPIPLQQIGVGIVAFGAAMWSLAVWVAREA